MKKFLIIMITTVLAACSSGVYMDELASKMPVSSQNNRSVMIRIADAGNPVSNGMLIGVIKVKETPSTKQLIDALAIDNLNIGVFGRSEAVNKAAMLYAIEHAPKIGKNTAVYFIGSASDKADLEKAANSKNIQLHYFVNTK